MIAVPVSRTHSVMMTARVYQMAKITIQARIFAKMAIAVISILFSTTVMTESMNARTGIVISIHSLPRDLTNFRDTAMAKRSAV